MLKIGHRGAPAHASENTIKSFRKALELGCEAIELDVHMCASGELVVIHDETLERTTNGKGKVAGFSLQELKKLDAGEGEKIPTLDEVIDAAASKARILIEIKNEKAADAVRQLIEKYGDYKNLVAISFNLSALESIKTSNSLIKLGFTFEEKVQLPDLSGYYSINPSVDVIDREIVENAHKSGLKVFCWTVNNKEQLKIALDTGADGIMTDDPNIFLNA